MNEELKAELETLKKGLEGKTAQEVKSAIEAFESKTKELVEVEVKSVKDAFDLEIKAIQEKAEADANKAGEDLIAMQDHIDKLDVKLQSKKANDKEKETFSQSVKNLVKDEFEKVKAVRKGNSVELEVKVVGDMTLGANLTGDQPRDYSNTVIAVPSQKVNFSDLLGPAINISGGTYTFPKEIASEGAIAAQVEGADISQIDYDIEQVDVSTDYLSGLTRYSKKMANNLPYLQSFLPNALRRDYAKSENTSFYTTLAAEALASTEIITGKNQVEMIINEVARLEDLDNDVNGIVVRPGDWYAISKIEKSTGAGYGLPGIVSMSNGQLTINGIPVYKATWLPANKYFVGDWTYVKKVVTEGLALEFSNEEGDNFKKNMISAKIQAQIALAVERNTAVILGDFTAV